MKNYIGIGVGILLLLMMIPSGVANEEQPDLIVEYLYHDFMGHHVPGYPVLKCNIKNQGNASVEDAFDIKISVIRCFFGIIPFQTVRTVSIVYSDGLAPNTSVDVMVKQGYNPPGLFGSFLFVAEVDTKNSIKECHEENNVYDTVFFKIFGQWL
jgi:hypothetical protein